MSIDANALTPFAVANGICGIDPARIAKAIKQTKLVDDFTPEPDAAPCSTNAYLPPDAKGTLNQSDRASFGASEPVDGASARAPDRKPPMSLPISFQHVTHACRTASGPPPVLDDLSIDMPEGSITAIIGPSGCGKSTLTRLIAGLMKPDEGIVRLGGESVTIPRKIVGMAFQNPVLLEWRTIMQNVTLPLEIVATGISKTRRQDRARELLALEGFEDKRPSELSGGIRQRASRCRSMVHRPAS